MCSCIREDGEDVSRSAKLRPKFCCLFYLQQRDLCRRFPVNRNFPKGLDSDRFLVEKGRHTHRHIFSPTRAIIISRRHLNMFVDFDGFVILALPVVLEQKIEASASMSCRQGSDLRLSWASTPKSCLISTEYSEDINYLFPLTLHFWAFWPQNLQVQVALFLVKQFKIECFHYISCLHTIVVF